MNGRNDAGRSRRLRLTIGVAVALAVAAAPLFGQTPQGPDSSGSRATQRAASQGDTTPSAGSRKLTRTPVGPRTAEQMEPSRANQVEAILGAMHLGNQLEVRLGELARRKGQSGAVRAYGARLAEDHRFADHKLVDLAESQGFIMKNAVALARAQPKTMVHHVSGEAEGRSQARTTSSSGASAPPDSMMGKADTARVVLGGPSEPGPQQIAKSLEQAPASEFDGMFLDAMVELHDRTISELETARSSVQDPKLQDLLDGLLPILRQHRNLAIVVEKDLGQGSRRSEGSS